MNFSVKRMLWTWAVITALGATFGIYTMRRSTTFAGDLLSPLEDVYKTFSQITSSKVIGRIKFPEPMDKEKEEKGDESEEMVKEPEEKKETTIAEESVKKEPRHAEPRPPRYTGVSLSSYLLNTLCNLSKLECGKIPAPDEWESADSEAFRARDLHLIRLIPQAIKYYLDANEFVYKNIGKTKEEYMDSLKFDVMDVLMANPLTRYCILHDVSPLDMSNVELTEIVDIVYHKTLGSEVTFAANFLLSLEMEEAK